MLMYKVQHGKPYQNLTRLKRQNYIMEVRFRCLLVRKIGTPSGPSIWVFCALSYFSAHIALGRVLGRTLNMACINRKNLEIKGPYDRCDLIERILEMYRVSDHIEMYVNCVDV